MRLQWSAPSCMWLLATCPPCGGKGYGRLTTVTCLLLAVALQFGIAVIVPHPMRRGTRPRAVVHVRRMAALAMGNLARVLVSGLRNSEPQTHA